MGKTSGIETPLKTYAAVGGQYKHGCSRKRMGRAERIDLARDVDMVGSCEYGNEPLGSIKFGEFRQ